MAKEELRRGVKITSALLFLLRFTFDEALAIRIVYFCLIIRLFCILGFYCYWNCRDIFSMGPDVERGSHDDAEEIVKAVATFSCH